MMHGRQGFTDGGSGGGAKPEEVRRVGRVRVYEIAKESGVSNKELVSKIQSLGIEVKNHMSSLDLDDVQRVKRALEKERQENLVEERLSPTVIRRRSKSPARRRRVGAPEPAQDGAGAEDGVAATEAGSPATAVDPAAEPVVEPAGGAQAETDPAAPPADAAAAAADVGEPDESSAEPAETAAGGEVSTAPAPAEPAETAAQGEGQPAAGQAEQGEASGAGTTAAGQVEQGEASGAGEPAAAAQADQAAKGDQAEPEDKSKARPRTVNARVAGLPQPGEKRELRYAPGFKPGMQYGPRSRKPEHRPAAAQQPGAPADTAISAADAMKMMAPAKPKVVITDLDGRRPGMRREVVTRRDLFSGRGGYKGPGKKRRKTTGGKRGKKTEITTPAQHKRVIRLQDVITVGEMAHQMGIKSTEVLKHLWAMGMRNLNINNPLDADTASLLATEFGYEVEDVSFNEESVLSQADDRPEDLQHRAPVVTVMGHVDHGKTSLLDAIRNTSVVSGEAGGITQHIGASKVTTPSGDLVFLDTPGHEAFTSMRARGAQCTDIVVLIVAADDGVMPQTLEAVDHARDARVPIIVAVNKIDRPNANPDRVRNELAERGLLPEDWGGDTLFVNISAKTHEGIDDLLENLHLQADLLELQANPEKLAVGTIIEAKLDKARGAMCSVLVQEGTLRVGDTVVTGEHMGKVRALLDDRGRSLKEAGPSTPVEVLGLGGVPQSGDLLNAVSDDKTARTLSEYRRNEHRKQEMAGATASKTYEEILGQLGRGEAKEVKLLVKADVHGSAEAVRQSLTKLGNDKVSVNVISAGVGGITENDVNLAKAAGAIIAGFNVRAAGKASQLAEREGVEIRIHDVIYELMDNVKDIMRGMLPKERREKFQGRAEVRQTFSIPKIGVVAGCAVQDGKITRNSLLRLVRNDVKIYDGKVGSLKRFKEDVREVVQGYECGLSIEGYKDIKEGDVIEAYEIEEVAPVLS